MDVALSEQEDVRLREYLESLDPANEIIFAILFLGAPMAGKKFMSEKMTWGYAFDMDPFFGESKRCSVNLHGRQVSMWWAPRSFPLQDANVNWSDECRWAPSDIRRSDVCMLSYDGRKRDSFDALETSYTLWRQVHGDFERHQQLFVVASREDLSDDWIVDEEEGKAFARKIGAAFTRMSVWTSKGMNDEDISNIMARIMFNRAAQQASESMEASRVRSALSTQKIPSSLLIAVLGADQTGKTRVIERIVSGSFEKYPDPDPPGGWTIKMTIKDVVLELRPRSQLIETQGRCEVSMKPALKLIRKAHIVLLLYDKMRPDTLEQIKRLYSAALADRKCDMDHKGVFLMATRSDNWQDWKVLLSEAEQVAKKINAEFLQVSALNGAGLGKETVERIIAKSLLKILDVSGGASQQVDAGFWEALTGSTRWKRLSNRLGFP